MAVHVRHPILIAAAPTTPGIRTFSLLYFLESMARATLVTVLPLTAYGLLEFRDMARVYGDGARSAVS